MSGGRITKVNKPKELFTRLTNRQDFKDAAIDFRLRLGVPKEGFEYAEDADRWIEEKRKSSDVLSYFVSMTSFLNKFGLRDTEYTSQLLEDYLLSNNKFPRPERPDSSFSFALIPPESEFSLKDSQKYIDVRVYATASKKEFLDYIESRWPLINLILHGQRPRGRIRANLNKGRDQRMLELFRLGRKELLKRAGAVRGDKHNLIFTILKIEGFHISSTEAVKKAIHRRVKISK